MNKIIAPLIQFLTSRKCCYELDHAREILHSGLESKKAIWRWLAHQDDAERFVMVSLLPLKAPEMRQNACAELLARINVRLGFGHFDLDFSDGQIAFRTVVPVGVRSRLRMSVVQHVIREHHTFVDQFLPAISAVLFAGLAPKEALATTREQEMETISSQRLSLN